MCQECRSIALSAVGFLLAAASGWADDWPQWLGPRRDGVWREDGIMDRFPAGGPKVMWRAPIGGGYSGPAVAGGRVYVTDRQAAKEPPKNGVRPGIERVLCFDAKKGNLLWKHEYDCPYKVEYPAGPRTTPVIHAGKVYTLGSMGDLFCLDAEDGNVRWSKSLVKEYQVEPPLWGYSAHLLVDGQRVFSLVGGQGSAVVAFDKDNGKELWKALSVKEIGYAPPMIYEAAGKRQLIVWHTEAVNALDPETGKLFWSVRFPTDVQPVRPAITVGTPRKAGDLLFVSSPHHGPLMLKLDQEKPGATILWKGTSDNLAKPDGLHALMATPFIKDGQVYGIGNFGDLRCQKADTGEQLWEDYKANGGKKTFLATAFMIEQGDRFLLLNDQGDLIIARLSPKGYEEIDRAHIIDSSQHVRGRDIVWCNPAFADRCLFVRNDKALVCFSMAAEKT